MHVWSIRRREMMTSSRLESLMEEDQGRGDFLIRSSLLEDWFMFVGLVCNGVICSLLLEEERCQ